MVRALGEHPGFAKVRFLNVPEWTCMSSGT
jgi:hypothetical protein